ncbi:unnamed protein product [Prorocentrum cordatum]|uniref:Palmitoyltransferase n=1 Tax=Prorocentrum cordatum TaxID=2364126 RepID=A0ABN9XW71_9DINO|nr:unnamed protein product [Polarella glacialis]
MPLATQMCRQIFHFVAVLCRSEPMLGICVVGGMCALLSGITFSVTAIESPENEFMQSCTRLGGPKVVMAILCVLYLLKLESAGEIKRSPRTCYPIPAEAGWPLRGRSLKGLSNITRVEGSSKDGTYCVRCLVWRPPKEHKPHHCNTCQRCVTGFDHHCGVFGRCIVNGNMVCFVTLIGLLFTGMCTAMVAVSTSSGSYREA